MVPCIPQLQPSAAATSPEPAGTHPIVWRAHFSPDITAHLISWGNPEGQVTNIDLELVGSLIYHACMVDCFDIHECTTLSRTDNMTVLWWQSKWSATSTFPPAHLLRLQAIQQRFYRYVPRHNFLSGVDNGISDHPYLSQDLTDAAFLAHMDALHTQELPCRLSTPPSELVYAISSAL